MPKGILLLESGSRIRPLQNPALNKSMNDPHASLTEHEPVGISQYEAIRGTSHEEPLMRQFAHMRKLRHIVLFLLPLMGHSSSIYI